jgi:hypothetical protein
MLGLMLVLRLQLPNGKQKNGTTTELEEVVVVCYHSPGGYEENEQLSQQWIYRAKFDTEASKL